MNAAVSLGTRWLTFNAVGAGRLLLQMATLCLLGEQIGLPYLLAASVSLEITILHNFVLHARWTWRDRPPVRTRVRQLARFNTLHGATATIVAEYLEAAGLKITHKEATALVYAIRTETQDFLREFAPADKALYDQMLPRIDKRALGKIQSATLPTSYFQTVHEALEGLETIQGVRVEAVWTTSEPPGAFPDLDVLGHVAGNPERAVITLADAAPGIFSADWAVVARAGASRHEFVHAFIVLAGLPPKGVREHAQLFEG